MDSDVAKFFDNKTIFLTGASGFVGKLLLQKLLRNCPGIKAIYVLIRPAKEKTAAERLDQILDNAIFDLIKSERPDFKDKVHVIPGDIKYKDLAITKSDRKKLIQNVNIVLHTAATVAFTSTLKEAVLTNVNGTKELLDMCEEMQELEVAMVMSTAYSHCIEFNIGEYFMNSPMKPDTILRMVEELDDEQFNKMEKNLLHTKYHKFPNNYVFTKAISEEAVKEKHGKIPVGLVRPSIILPTYTDPLRNWADNFYGPVGLATIMALGVMHIFFSKTKCKIDQVPADYCINAFIAATYDTYKKYQKEKQPMDIVYNNTGNENSITIKQLVDYCKQFYTVPLDKAVWAVSIRQTSCVYDYWIFSILCHFIPALLADFVRLFCLRKPKFFKMYWKIEKMNQLFGYFTTSEWNMANDNMMKVYHNLNKTDKAVFPFDISTIDWTDYYRDSSYYIKKYLFREKLDPESVEKSKKRYARLKIYHKIFLAAIYSLSAFVIWKIVHMFSACVNRHFSH